MAVPHYTTASPLKSALDAPTFEEACKILGVDIATMEAKQKTDAKHAFIESQAKLFGIPVEYKTPSKPVHFQNLSLGSPFLGTDPAIPEIAGEAVTQAAKTILNGQGLSYFTSKDYEADGLPPLLPPPAPQPKPPKLLPKKQVGFPNYNAAPPGLAEVDGMVLIPADCIKQYRIEHSWHYLDLQASFDVYIPPDYQGRVKQFTNNAAEFQKSKKAAVAKPLVNRIFTLDED